MTTNDSSKPLDPTTAAAIAQALLTRQGNTYNQFISQYQRLADEKRATAERLEGQAQLARAEANAMDDMLKWLNSAPAFTPNTDLPIKLEIPSAAFAPAHAPVIQPANIRADHTAPTSYPDSGHSVNGVTHPVTVIRPRFGKKQSNHKVTAEEFLDWWTSQKEPTIKAAALHFGIGYQAAWQHYAKINGQPKKKAN